jgi:hypothetical protein
VAPESAHSCGNSIALGRHKLNFLPERQCMPQKKRNYRELINWRLMSTTSAKGLFGRRLYKKLVY